MMQSPRYRKCTPALWRGLCSIPLALRLSEELGVFGGEKAKFLQLCVARLRYPILARHWLWCCAQARYFRLKSSDFKLKSLHSFCHVG